jgi:hypothetical protein
MLVCCWSVKGGTGTTVVSVALALRASRTSPGGAVLVDLAGDVPAALGVAADGAGVADWLRAGSDVPADGLARVVREVAPGLELLSRGRGPFDPGRAEVLARLFAADGRTVVVDCGLVRADAPDVAVSSVLAAGATHSLLVLRPCFLALRRAVEAPLRPSAVVLVREEGRAIAPSDVESVLGVPVHAEVRVTPQVARAVDAGLLLGSLPSTLLRDLRHAGHAA